MRMLRMAPVAALGVAAALGTASLTQAQSGGGSGTTSTSTTATGPTTSTTSTATTPTTTTTKTTTTPKAAPKPKATKRTITCRVKLIAVRPPVDSSEDYGTLTCSTPFGKGVQRNTATVVRSSPTAGTFTGSFKLFLNEGTLRGTFKMTFTIAGGATYKGTMRISSGTGDYAGIKGTGTLTGTSSDAVKTALTQKLDLTIPPPKADG